MFNPLYKWCTLFVWGANDTVQFPFFVHNLLNWFAMFIEKITLIVVKRNPMQFALLHFIENVWYIAIVNQWRKKSQIVWEPNTLIYCIKLIRLRKLEIQYVLTIEIMNNEYTLRTNG